MRGLSFAVVAGNLGRDPEVRSLKSGQIMANLVVAVSRKDKEGDDKVDWITIRCFGKTAETCQKYLSKGDSVLVVGRVCSRSVEDNGYTKNVIEIIGSRVHFINTKKRIERVEEEETEPPF